MNLESPWSNARKILPKRWSEYLTELRSRSILAKHPETKKLVAGGFKFPVEDDAKHIGLALKWFEWAIDASSDGGCLTASTSETSLQMVGSISHCPTPKRPATSYAPWSMAFAADCLRCHGKGCIGFVDTYSLCRHRREECRDQGKMQGACPSTQDRG